MAVQNNGQPIGPIVFTDDRPGKRLFMGPNTPATPVDGDIWFDSDVFNNAGKNLISTVSLNTFASRDLSIVTEYKDVYVVFRGVQTSANATVNITLNDNTSNYATGTALFSITNVKSAVTTNHWSVDIVDTQDTASFAWGYLKGVYTNASNAVTIIDSTNAFTQSTALTKMTISVSTGTFTGGTALVYGVN
jgi:hypothetical protein